MGFLWPELLWLLFLVPIFVLIYVIIQRRRQKYSLRYASLSMVKEAMGRGPGFSRHVPAILFIIGVAAMLVAMSRPTATVMTPSNEGTVILTLDVSRSMTAEDLQPNRLEAAKAAAKAFVNNQPRNVRIGVVSFSNMASLVQVPTTDREQILASINRLSPQMGTAIGQGILTSLNAIFEQQGISPKPTPTDAFGNPLSSKAPPTVIQPGSFAPAVIILLSDGQNNVPPAPLSIIDQAASAGVRVYTVGVGSTDGTILRYMGRATRVFLDENTLKSIAKETQAQYFKADNESDLRTIYSTLGSQLVFKPQETELTAWFTGFAMLVLIVSGLLSLLWFRRVL
jgi:Ca-activated chloride channel homolog